MGDIGPLSYVEAVSLVVFVGLAVAGAVYVASGAFMHDFHAVTKFVSENQTEGFFVLVGALTVGSLLPGPLFLVVIAAGFAFDSFVVAVLGCYVGSLLGAVLNFAVTRLLLRDTIQRHVVDRYKIVRAIDNVVQRKGLVLVGLLRLPYAPYTKMNFVLSCTGVSFRDYVVGTAVGIVLPILVMVGLGTGLHDMSDQSQLPGWFVVTAIVVIVAVFAGVVWYASRLLDEEVVRMDKEQHEGAGEEDPLVREQGEKDV